MDKVVNAIMAVLLDIGQWLQGYMYDISLLLVVCFISLYADDIIKITKRFVVRQNFVLRVLCFVLVTGFGFSIMIVFVRPFLSQGLSFFGTQWLAITILMAFVILGIIADKKNQL